MTARLRHTGRIVVFVLLAWTAVDLMHHAVCGGAGAPSGTAAVVAAAASPAHASQPGHVDHSFCCSQTVDVRTPFHLALTFSAVGLLRAERVTLPFAWPDRLFHPPLAES